MDTFDYSIPFSTVVYVGNEERYVADAMKSTWLSGGEFINKLEDELSSMFNRGTLLTSNGTSAINLAYLALGLRSGDEIIVPGYGFQALSNVAIQLGIKPVFVDADPYTWLIDPELIEKNITPLTKAIAVIHNYGYVCEMDSIIEIADRYKLPVIEDCAESIFSQYKGQYCGTFGDIGTFSFHATKTITCGEGGLFITSSPSLYKTAALYRSHGLEVRGTYNHILPGNNFRMTNLQAAIGYAQVEQVDLIAYMKYHRTDSYLYYLEGERGVEVIRPNNEILWSLPVRLNPRYFPPAKEVIKELARKGIGTRPGFVPATKFNYVKSNPLPVSEGLSRTTIVLPLHLGLEDCDIKNICSELLFLRR